MRKILLIISTLCMLQTNGQQNLTAVSRPPSENYRAGSETIYTLTDKMAGFPGGPSGWDKYVHKNIDYSIPLKNNAPAGRYTVIVLFIINEKGLVSDLKALTKHGFGLEDEVLRVVAKGPRWIPAVHRGKAVKSYRKQPLTFVVR